MEKSTIAENREILSKDELGKKAEELVIAYNDARTEENFKAMSETFSKLDETLKDYTKAAETECFFGLKYTENPMISAVKQLTFQTLKAKEEKVGDMKIPTLKLEQIEKPIDLIKLHEYVGDDGIGENKLWWAIIQKLNFLLTAQKAVDLGIKPDCINSSYKMSEIAKDIQMGKTPTSKTNILKTLNTVITAMIGSEYKATSHDVAYLMSIYSKKNRKALCVTCANHKHITQYIAEICHRIVLGKSYSIEYKKIN